MGKVLTIVPPIAHGIWCGLVFHWYTSRADLRPVMDAIIRSWKSLISDDGKFLITYRNLVLRALQALLLLIAAAAVAGAPIMFFLPMTSSQLWLWGILSGLTSTLWAFAWKILSHQPKERSATVDIDNTQHFFLQIARSTPALIKRAERAESRLLKGALKKREIARPVFVTGLARSGTTIILEQLARAESVATHKYRDFPFVLTPWLWNSFYGVFGKSQKPRERAHGDGIRVNSESPEAFEEVVWQTFFPFTAAADQMPRFTQESSHPEFEQVLRRHIRKVLMIRKGVRYLSKGNYNVARILYLRQLFPDAHFIVPVRHPVTHVTSLVRQHQRFMKYAEQDSRIGEYLASAGHFEFGPQRHPLPLGDDPEETLQAWNANDDLLGYSIEWARVYRYVNETLAATTELSSNLHLIRYEDLCASPRTAMLKILSDIGLEEEADKILGSMDEIRAAVHNVDEAAARRIWDVTGNVAGCLGYRFDDIGRPEVATNRPNSQKAGI